VGNRAGHHWFLPAHHLGRREQRPRRAGQSQDSRCLCAGVDLAVQGCHCARARHGQDRRVCDEPARAARRDRPRRGRHARLGSWPAADRPGRWRALGRRVGIEDHQAVARQGGPPDPGARRQMAHDLGRGSGDSGVLLAGPGGSRTRDRGCCRPAGGSCLRVGWPGLVGIGRRARSDSTRAVRCRRDRGWCDRQGAARHDGDHSGLDAARAPGRRDCEHWAALSGVVRAGLDEL